MTFEVNFEPTPPIFSEKNDVSNYESVVPKNLNLILLLLELSFILDCFLLVFNTFSTASYRKGRSLEISKKFLSPFY